jgi:hypothetical protein
MKTHKRKRPEPRDKMIPKKIMREWKSNADFTVEILTDVQVRKEFGELSERSQLSINRAVDLNKLISDLISVWGEV